MAFGLPAENRYVGCMWQCYFYSFGFSIIGFSVLLVGGLVLYTFGTRFAAAMCSVAISMIGGQTSRDIARLFATIAIMEALGVLLS